jgi:hypothetical protein
MFPNRAEQTTGLQREAMVVLCELVEDSGEDAEGTELYFLDFCLFWDRK